MINENAPEFKGEAYFEDEIQEITLSDYKGKWLVLFFYPGDFTFVCPTELGELAENYDKFQEMDTEIVSVSTDSAYVHKAWHDKSQRIGKIKFPMLADPTLQISRDYRVLIEDEGVSLRGTFIINPEGKIKAFEVHDNDIGRSIKELLRKLQAAQYVSKHSGKACPVNWEPGEDDLEPGMDLVGEL